MTDLLTRAEAAGTMTHAPAMKVAALYVQPGGVYWNLPDVEPLGLPERDARYYAGPWPVVAHPPCERWGRYWSGGPSARVRRVKGDDGGCFASALASVEKFGGVLEHPEASHAWAAHGMPAPFKSGGYSMARDGWTCCVEQGHYGHRARKATWLYIVGCRQLPPLLWGPSRGERLDEGFHSREEREAARARGDVPRKRLSTAENIATPIPFRDLLLSIARSCRA